MAFYLGKILQTFLWPLNWALAAFLLAFGLSLARRERAARGVMLAAFVALFLPSTPWMAHRLLLPLETDYPVSSTEKAPPADAIVVLGGSVLPKLPPRGVPDELGGSRIRPAAALYAAGKSKLVVVSSGVPYRGMDGKQRIDAEDMKELLVEYGVPETAILLENRSRNTTENALYTGELLKPRGLKRVLLVTHAFHMRRAVAQFERQGMEVIPFPTAIESVEQPFHVSQLVPSASSLALSTRAIKEYVGRWMGY